MQIYLQAPYPFWYFDGVTPKCCLKHRLRKLYQQYIITEISTFFIFFITNLRIGELRFEI